MEERILEEHSIDSYDFAKRLLEQWRGILVIAIICAVLFPGLKYFLDLRSYRAAMTGLQTEEAVKPNDSILQVLNAHKLVTQRREYFEHSYLMQLDASKEKCLSLNYYVSKPEGSQTDLASVCANFENLLSADSYYEVVKGAFGTSKELHYISELCSTELDPEVSSFLVSVILPEGIDAGAVAAAVDNYVLGSQAEVSGKMGEFYLQNTSSTVEQKNDTEVIRKQTEIFTSLDTLKLSFDNAYAALSEEDQMIVNELISSGDYLEVLEAEMNENLSEGEAAKIDLSRLSAAIKPQLNKKFIVVGFLGGIILYIIVYFLIFVFSKRFSSEKEIEDTIGLPSYGGVYRYPYKNPVMRFVHSKKVYQWRHKASGTPKEAAAAIAAQLLRKAEQMDVSRLSIISLGQENAFVKEVLGYQKHLLKSAHADAALTNLNGGVHALRDEVFDRETPVFLAIISKSAKYDMAGELLSRLGELNVPVIGTEFIEGR